MNETEVKFHFCLQIDELVHELMPMFALHESYFSVWFVSAVFACVGVAIVNKNMNSGYIMWQGYYTNMWQVYYTNRYKNAGYSSKLEDIT